MGCCGRALARMSRLGGDWDRGGSQTPRPEGSCNAATMGRMLGCPKAPHAPSLHQIWVPQALQSRGLGQRHPLAQGDARAGRLDAPGSQRWRCLGKGKLRQHEMLWMRHCASGGRSCSECQGRGSAPQCQSTPVPAHGRRKLNTGTRDNLGTVTGAFGKGSMSRPVGMGQAEPSTGVVNAEEITARCCPSCGHRWHPRCTRPATRDSPPERGQQCLEPPTAPITPRPHLGGS